MRIGARMMLLACCAGPVAAAMLVTGSGPANASPLTPAVNGGISFIPGGGHGGGHGPGGGYGPGGGRGPGGGHGRPGCDQRQLERWDLNGGNTVDLAYTGGTATYAVTLRQEGSCLGGTLTDLGIPNGPQTGPIFGTVNGDNVTFSFKYTYIGSHQGTRTFTGTIDRRGRGLRHLG